MHSLPELEFEKVIAKELTRKQGMIYVDDVVDGINKTGYVFLANVLRRITEDKRQDIEYILARMSKLS